MKQYLLIFILVFGFSANFAFADADSTTGFIPGAIWYSHDPLVEGDTVKIYTAVWNGDALPLSARVEFYDKNVVLGTRDVVVEKASLKDVSISWKVTSGDHTISAKIISSNTTTAGKSEKVALERTSTESDKVFVSASGSSSKDQVAKAKDDINSIIPDSVSSSIADTFGPVESMRRSVSEKVSLSKKETKEKIAELEGKDSIVDGKIVIDQKPLDSTEKPIAYIKLFLLSIVGFIFGSQIVFYGLAIAITLWLLRFIYRKVRHR